MDNNHGWNNESPHTSASEHPKVPTSRIWLMALVEFCSLGALAAPLAITLSLKVLQIVPPSQKEISLSLVTSIGALCALIANPIFGYISDMTRSRWGRRRPWIIAGVTGGFISALLMGSATNIAVLTLSWALSQIFYNAALAALSALLADQLPDSQRSKASGIFGAAGFLGTIPAMLVAALFAGKIWPMILFMPLIGVVLVPIACRMIPERAEAASQHTADKHNTARNAITAFFFNPFTHGSYSLLWLQRFVMQFGYTVVGTYGLYYLLVRLHMATTEATRLTALVTIVGAIVNFVAAMAIGYLASRSGNYLPAMIVSIVLMTISLFAKAFTADIRVFWLATIAAGLALGMYYAIDLASVMRVLPEGNQGRFLGMFNVAKSLPQSLAPAAASLFLSIGGNDPIAGSAQNYMSLYVGAGILVAGSLLLALPIRKVLSHPVVAAPHQDAAACIPSGTDEAVSAS